MHVIGFHVFPLWGFMFSLFIYVHTFNLTRVGRLALTQGTEHNYALEAMHHFFLFVCCQLH